MSWLTKLALKNRWVTFFLVAVVTGASIWGFLGLKVELIPDISFPYSTVVTVYPQATPDAVTEEVTGPIEQVIWDEWNGHGLKHVTSTSSAGLSVVMAEFEFGTDMTAVTTRLGAALDQLPMPPAVTAFPRMMGSDSKNPQIIPLNLNSLPIINLSLSGDLPPEQLKQIADSQIVPLLSQADGVLRVETEGGNKDQIVITPDPDRMNSHGISTAQIAALLASDYTSLQGVAQTPLADGVVLADVASIAKSPPPLSAITRTNGHPSVGISVIKTEDANTVDTSNAVKEKLATIEGQLPQGVTISTVLDQSDFIKASVNQLWEKAIIGAVLAVLVVFFFLWAVRASLITAISIPLSVFIAFLCMRLAGVTLNVLTLSALTIAIGRLIDDSIVMIEVIFRRIRRGEPAFQAAIGGAREVATPITSATLATVAIFLPLMFVGGIVGEMFLPFGLTVTFAMLASLLVALVLIPTLAKMLESKKPKPVTDGDNWYQKAYTVALRWTLGHRVFIVIGAVVLLFISMGLLGLTGTSFLSGAMGEPTITVNIALPPATEINTTSDVTGEVETLLAGIPGIRSYDSTIGTSATSMAGIMSASQGGGGANTASITIYLKSEADLEPVTANILQSVKALPESGYIAVSGAESGGGGMGGGIANNVMNLSVQGQDQADIAAVTEELVTRLQGVDGLSEVASDLTRVVPRLNIAIDPARIAAAGLPPAQTATLQQEFALLMNGGPLPGKSVNLDNESYPVYLKAIAGSLSGVDQANSLAIGFPATLTLGDVADVTIQDLPSHISHTDTMLSATVTGTITAKNIGAVNRLVQQQVDALPPHPGVEVKTTGITEEMVSTFSRMGLAIIVAIFIVFAIVILMMRSVVNPLIIMVSLPLAFIGSVPALLITGHTLGVSAMMGLLMLVGIVLTNAIVLVAMVEQKQREGLEVREALLEGGRIRLRPILMTALTTILAMIPMAVATSSGTILSAELAIVVIGGMVSSTFLTLFVIPAVYSLAHRKPKKSKQSS